MATKQQKTVRALVAVGVVVALLVILSRRAAAQGKPTEVTVTPGKAALFSESAAQSNADRITSIPREDVVTGGGCR